ncbi:MAG: thiol-disulfide isomerase [Bryobacteraceae bacterium]
MTYDSTRPWAKAIKQAVATKKMPPWYADPKYGHFSNDRSLTESEIATLTAWADSGAKAGDAKFAPKPVSFIEGWAIGKPDMVIQIPEPIQIPASGTIDYQYVIVPTGFTEDRYVSVAEARPSNLALTHHIIAFIREPGTPWFKDEPLNKVFIPQKGGRGGGGFGGDMLSGYAPGTPPLRLAPGQAKLVKAGSDIVFQLHYTANGTAGTDRSKVGIIFAKEKPTERVLTLAAANNEFGIPPNDPNYRVDSKITLQEDAKLVQLLPHMHLRGKDFLYKVTYPTGETETLLSVPNYSFSWQLWYKLAQEKVLPKGTTIECTAHFDNSKNNGENPDPSKTIRFGEQSWDEMMIGFFDVAVPLNVTPMDLMRPKHAPKPRPSAEE